MKKIISMNLSLLFILTIISSCTDSNSNNECINVEYDQAFKIEENNKYCFPDGNYFEVLEIKNEFCPCDGECVWAGEMILHYKAEIDGNIIDDSVGSDPHVTNNELGSKDYIILFTDIKFVIPCSNADPSPTIESAMAVVTKQ